jgi:hypothetical protein
MLKSVFTQIINRKQSNSWILIELVLVFCLVWYIADYFFVLGYNYSIPDCRNIEHTWYVELGRYPSDYPAYSAEADNPTEMEADFNRILRNMRNHPDVEALGVSFWGAIPGGLSWNGQYYRSVDDTVHVVGGQSITIDPREDYFRVFGYTADGGKRPVSTHDFDWSNPRGIVAGQLSAKKLFPDGQAEGKELVSRYTSENSIILGVVDDVKRFDYLRPHTAYYIPMRLDSVNLRNADISIRSKASVPDAIFRERFKKDMPNSMSGNFYLKDLTSSLQISSDTDTQTGQTNDVRVRLYMMLFFLLNILLCILGTFRYRISTRRHETGVRKAAGSTNNRIRNIFLIEGLCLLTAAMLPAMLVEVNLVYAGLIATLGRDAPDTAYLPDRTALRFIITNTLTWVIMAAVIVAAIWLPARKAAAVPPAEALHYE